MSREAVTRKLTGLVEGAGFVLAVSLDQVGLFRILAPNADATVVGSVAVTASGFKAFFPGERLQVSTPTGLVDALEQVKAEL